MAKDTFTGPLIALGGMAGGPGSNQPREYSDEIGPSMFWGGTAIVASSGPGSKDRTGPGSISAVYCASPIRTINCPPAASASLTTAGNATAGTPFVNITTYAAGLATGVPVIGPSGPTTGIGLDMGLDVASFATNGTVTLTGASVGNSWRYRPGQWICLLNNPANAVLMTQVQTVPTVSTMTVSPAPGTATSGQIAITNRFNPNLYGASGPPSSISSQASAGAARIHIPELGTTRCVGITGVASGTGGQILIQGVGAFGMPVSEIITATAGATTVWGKKTYDIFISATPLFTDAHNYTVKTGDFFGFPLSIMSADSIVSATFGGTALVLSGTTTGVVVPADPTYPATQTTGDPRGGLQLTANGPVTGPTGTLVTLNGTTLLTVDQRLNPLQVALATTINPGPLTGVPGV